MLWLAVTAAPAQQPFTVPTGPPRDAASTSFRDSRYGVRFQVPPGWTLTRKDREVSTFRLDARSASRGAKLRGVVSMGFNPFPRSVLSGALVYYSVSQHANDKTCAAEAAGAQPRPEEDGGRTENAQAENIGGMPFVHGHDEHGYICVEGRDEVYTAYRRGSCYRFDLTLNTFCAISSGAAELSREQIHRIEEQMAGILSTVSLDWEKTGPQPVPVPEVNPGTRPRSSPRHPLPAASVDHKPAAGTSE